jgi:hypothetical protein
MGSYLSNNTTNNTNTDTNYESVDKHILNNLKKSQNNTDHVKNVPINFYKSRADNKYSTMEKSINFNS